MGRVVVEIKQAPRRGRGARHGGTHSGGSDIDEAAVRPIVVSVVHPAPPAAAAPVVASPAVAESGGEPTAE
jgi:hypothetical protein